MRIVFMGSPDFAVQALEAIAAVHDVCLVVTQPDKRAGRGKRLSPPPVKVVAEREGLTVVQPASARTDEFLQCLLEAKAEVAVVVAYGKILPLAVLEAFPHGCINIHGSLLPKYRGAAPIQRAVMGGDTETGVSIMRLDEGMDTGPVLLTRRMPIHETDTAGTVFERMAPLGASAVLEALEGLDAGTLQATEQDDSAASHAAMLSKQDGLVDWTRPAAAVAARIQGLDPWPGSFSTYAGANLKVFGARVCDGEGVPGTLVAYEGDAIIIACGARSVRILEVQAPGKKRMSAASFARGRRLEPGIRLGEDSLSSENKI